MQLRLSAVDEAASTVVLCADKTGTLTQNALTVTTVQAMPGFDEAHVLGAGCARPLGWRRPGRWRHTRGRRKQDGL
jgi:magnesium-transporting ATPase (P-type)